MHSDAIKKIMDNAPTGAGIETLNLIHASGKCIEFWCSYHHMNHNGYYDDHSGHCVTVKPDLQFDISIRVNGRNRNDIKDYLGDVFQEWLMMEEK